MRALLEPAARLAIELDHPAYDCMYLALAVQHGWTFVTADLRFIAKARQTSPTLGAALLGLSEAAAL